MSSSAPDSAAAGRSRPGGHGPAPVGQDSRGILDPWLLRQRVTLTRYAPTPALDGLVDRFWAVQWELPRGTVHRQQVLTHPGANLSVGNAGADESGVTTHRDPPVEARLNGVTRGLSTRALAGTGWTVAAMTRPGGLGAFVAGLASDFTDRVVPLGQAIGTDEPALLREMVAEPDEENRAGVLARALEQAVDPGRVRPARQVADVARLAETDRSIRRLGDLCAAAGVRQRTLQRMFLQYAGVSPTWVLRRYRLLEVAEAVRDGGEVAWGEIAADLGYADQAHLISDFRAVTGQTPAAYAAAQGPGSLPSPPGAGPGVA